MSSPDSFIKQDIQDALDLAPSFKSKNIIINVENGIVTPCGVPGTPQKASL
jgi:osmotically-inducible protein OsmY